MKIIIINGPNLSKLGEREPDVYGKITLKNIEDSLKKKKEELGDIELDFFQSDIEGEIVKFIGDNTNGSDGILINPAGYTHTSVAIHDAILASKLPSVEVHISQIYKREKFRHTSLISSACIGQIAGFGINSYILGLQGLIDYLRKQ